MINLVHCNIKIKYVGEGYLPNYPYHLISDKEMFEAFLGEDIIDEHSHVNHDHSFMNDYYPCPDESLKLEYDELLDEIKYHIKKYLLEDKTYEIPDWIYSYMLGVVINNHSSQQNKHYLLTMLGLDNLMDELDVREYKEILKVSSQWVSKSSQNRKPTMFGEPHVIKSLRLQLIDNIY